MRDRDHTIKLRNVDMRGLVILASAMGLRRYARIVICPKLAYMVFSGGLLMDRDAREVTERAGMREMVPERAVCARCPKNGLYGFSAAG